MTRVLPSLLPVWRWLLAAVVARFAALAGRSAAASGGARVARTGVLRAVFAVCLLGGVVAADAAVAATGDLVQKSGTAGCLSESGVFCADATALDGASSVTVSPDGRSAYAASEVSDAVTVFDRAPDGALTQKPGTAGCISDTGSGGLCVDGSALDGARSVTVSPDGRSAYVASVNSDAVAVFDRALDGTLTQKSGTAGCISNLGSGGACIIGTALDGAVSVTVSPDGKSAYVASRASGSVGVFDRAPDGTLAQKADTAGCISDTGSGGVCVDGKALDWPVSVAISPDGRSAYIASEDSDAVAVFDRAADGTLTQKSGTAGCISNTGDVGACVDGTALLDAESVTVSPDGQSVYVASNNSDGAVAVFDRAADGTLIQKGGTEGCISEEGNDGACVDGTALEDAFSVTVSPDGQNVYVAAQFSDAVAVFDRAADGGLTQKPGAAGCISDAGASPCTDGTALDGATSVTASPDGRSVYVASSTSDAVAVLDREPADFTLIQKTGTSGCISDTGAGPCVDGTALDEAFSVTVSPDGTSAYAASRGGNHGVAVFDRAADGTLTQKPGTAGCISDTGAGPCVDGTALDFASSVTVSPDGKSAYVASQGSNAVAVFDRAADGTLTQKPGTAGCISNTGAGPCADGTALDRANSVTVSPDGTSAYVAGGFSSGQGAVAVFDRAPDGTLTQKPGTAGCISDSGAGPCVDGTALSGAFSVTVSPDGTSAYVASSTDDAVAVFDRAADGTLTQKPGTAGCISDTGASPCASGTAIDDPASVTVSPDGRSAYVASFGSGAVGVNDRGAVAVFDRAADGTLTQKPGTAGCISDTGSGGLCVDGTALELAHSVIVSPDGRSVYIASLQGNAVAVLDRAVDGTLTQKPGTAGCISELGSGGACVDGTALNSPRSVTVSPDGRSVYLASSNGDAVAVFDRVANAGPPETTIDSGPAAGSTTGDSTPTFAFSASESGSSFECRVDAQAFAACSSPHTTAALGDGQHTFEVRATDQTGNTDQTPASRTFTVDTAAPETTIDSGPAAGSTTGDSTPTFAFSSSEPGSSFECRVDAQAFVACSTPHTTAALGEGQHTFEVRAIDALGNVDQTPASRTFTVDHTPPPGDSTPPVTSIVSGPGGISDDRTPTFTFSSNEPGSSFECSIDGGPFSACSSPFTAPPLTGGLHTLRVRARDAAGNQGEPASFSFQITLTLGELNASDPPTLGVDVNVAKVGSGVVLVGIPGGAARAAAVRASQKGVTFVPLTQARQIPIGSFLNTRRGTVRLTSARDAAGRTQTGDFGRGLFQVIQSRKRSAKGLTDLVLKGGSFARSRCGSPGRAGRARAAALRRRTVRRLRSNARGRFRTRGRHSAATVRGTVWETIDRCDGTLTKVTRGRVTVRDLRRRRNVVVRAGKSYLARAPG